MTDENAVPGAGAVLLPGPRGKWFYPSLYSRAGSWENAEMEGTSGGTVPKP